MYSQYAYFNELPVNCFFICNGNECKKQSARTAKLLAFDTWFYFGKNDLCVVGKHSRLSKDYFS